MKINQVCRVLGAVAVLSLGVIGPASGSAAGAPDQCSAEELATRAYSPMYVDNTMQVFDPAGPELRPVKTVGGFATPAELVMSGDGRTLYVNDWQTGTLDVVDACTVRITKRIPVGTFAISTYIPAQGDTFSGRYLYVSSLASASISVVDTQTESVVSTYLVPGIANVHISPSGDRLYAVTALGVLPLDARTGRQVAPFLPTGTSVPTWMTTSADGSKLYVAGTAGDNVTIVDARTMRVIKTIGFPFGTSPIVAKVTPDGRQVWFANGASKQGIIVLDTTTDSVVKVIQTNGMAPYVSFSPDSKWAYVPEAGAASNSAHLGLVYLVAGVANLVRGPGDIRVFSTDTLQQAGPVVPVGQMPGDVATTQPGVSSGG
jgi:YVTN family beta-propeller protein